MTNLSVNLNKIALLRNARDLDIPSVLDAARVCISAGVHGITVHPRPDERHIRRTDVYDLSALLVSHKEVEFNIEGNPFEEAFMPLVLDVRPAQCTLVPDDPNQRTSDHGWDIKKDGERLKPIIEKLHEAGIRVSLFMDPDVDQIALAAGVNTDRIELYTEPYAANFNSPELVEQLSIYARAASVAQELGMGVNAGHDLNQDNLPAFVKIPNILEVSIGHALIADAVFDGLNQTVKKYLALVSDPV